LTYDTHREDIGNTQGSCEKSRNRSSSAAVIARGLKSKLLEHAVLLVPFGNRTEEKVRFLTAKRQVTELSDHQQVRTLNNVVEVLPRASLMVYGNKLLSQLEG